MSSVIRQEALRMLVRRLELHSRLSDSDRSNIFALPGEIRPVKARSDFLHAREATDHACLVAAGLVARYVPLADGSRQIVSLHLPGDMVDIYSFLLSHTPMPLTALSPAEILRIPHVALREMIDTTPSLVAVLWRDTVVEGHRAAQTIVNVGRRDARGRVAHLLCELAVRLERIGELNGSSFAFPITQEQLGDMLALTSVHVNRTLKALRDDKLVRIASGRVDILDWNKLRDAAGFDSSYLSPNAESWPPVLGKLA